MIYQTNQATDSHLLRTTVSAIKPLTSGIVSGRVSQKPKVIRGGHVIMAVTDQTGELYCAAYEPTRRFRDVVKKLQVGDSVRVFGGIKKKENLPLTLNLEKIEILNLLKICLKSNPFCTRCGRRAKSEGKGKGYRCRGCGQMFKPGTETYTERPRELEIGLYEVPPRARRHLAKPLIRILC